MARDIDFESQVRGIGSMGFMCAEVRFAHVNRSVALVLKQSGQGRRPGRNSIQIPLRSREARVLS